MANRDAAFGLKPSKHYFGGTIRANEYRIADDLAADIYQGDPVKSTGTTKQITVAAAGDVMLGVFDGVVFQNDDGEIKYSARWPTGQSIKTGSEAVALVYDDPHILYEVQMSGAFAVTDIGNLADLVIGTGSSVTGRSGTEVDSTTIGDTGDIGVKIVDYVRDGQNEVGDNARVLVLLNQHEHNTSTMTGV